MLQNIKANIIKPYNPSQIKINRRRIDKEKEIYEISVKDFCQLIDALSKGKFINYVNYIYNNGIFTINEQSTMCKMMEYLLKRLSQDNMKKIFGKDSKIHSLPEFMLYISQCKWYTKSFVANTIKTYINTNYYILNNNFIRKTNRRS